MIGTGALDDLIRRARRRHIENLLLRQGIRAASVAMGGLILLLLIGTQVLDWPWIVVLAAVSLLGGFRTFRKEIPSPYSVAQQIDRRLELHDSLSTALFYNRIDSGRRSPDDLRTLQLAQAEALASGVDLHRAVPFAFPKSLYVMAVLGLVASSLFALRYGIYRSLDLRPPLATIVLDMFHFFSEPRAAEKKKREIHRAGDQLKQTDSRLNEEAENNPAAQGSAPGFSSEAQDAEIAKREAADASKQLGSASAETLERREQKGADRGEGAGDESASASQDQDENLAGARQSNGDASGRSSASQQAASSQHDSGGLLEKFRDAMQNLLSRLRQQPRTGDSQMASRNGRRPSDQQPRNEAQKGAQGAGKTVEGAPNGNGEGDEQGEGAQKAENGPGKQGGRDSEQASAQGHSGIGKEEGSKQIREAEQLAAMGKISELIGKRSQNLTGEVMVEVSSGKQELRTAYSQQASRHSDSGGEIHRDEIPLAYERYVQQYFDEIRKTAPPSGKSGSR